MFMGKGGHKNLFLKPFKNSKASSAAFLRLGLSWHLVGQAAVDMLLSPHPQRQHQGELRGIKTRTGISVCRIRARVTIWPCSTYLFNSFNLSLSADVWVIQERISCGDT